MFRIQIQKRRKCFVQIPINPEPQLVVLLFATCSLNLLVDGPRAIALRNRGDSHSAQKWQRNPHHMTTH